MHLKVIGSKILPSRAFMWLALPLSLLGCAHKQSANPNGAKDPIARSQPKSETPIEYQKQNDSSQTGGAHQVENQIPHSAQTAEAQTNTSSADSTTASGAFTLSSLALDGSFEPYVSHSGAEKMQSWVGLQLSYNLYRSLFEQVQARYGPISNRGEAHVTVITPVEFEKIKDKITIEELDEMAKKAKLQKTRLQAVCMGRGQAEIGGKTESTYFVVVSSEPLFLFRWSVFKKLAEKGVEKSTFNPDHYFPHVTIGYSKRDLHEDDGVTKNKESCVAPIKLKR